MCGRFTLASTVEQLHDLLELQELPTTPPRYNIAPSQPVLAVRMTASGQREGVLLRWGLVPRWTKGDKIEGYANARSETAAEKPTFRDAYRQRRCLIAADGFYEWAGSGRNKQPWHFRLADGSPFVMAGLWEAWRSPAGLLETCCLLTTEANDVVRPVHERMPVILPDQNATRQWLDETTSVPDLQAILAPLPSERMACWPVSSAVNSARHEGPDLLTKLSGLFET